MSLAKTLSTPRSPRPTPPSAWTRLQSGLLVAAVATAPGCLLLEWPGPEANQEPVPGDTVLMSWGRTVLLPAGKFTMGCVEGRDDQDDACDAGSRPAHDVTLTHPFWIMDTELTQDNYAELALRFTAIGRGDGYPAGGFTFWQAAAVANAASELMGEEPCYELLICQDGEDNAPLLCNQLRFTAPSGNPYECTGWRLPTEAEWEYAARGGLDQAYAGGDDVDEVASYYNNSGQSEAQAMPVASHFSNGFGLWDMSGNVREWVSDLEAPYDGEPIVDPHGDDDDFTFDSIGTLRGGSYTDAAKDVRAQSRQHVNATLESYLFGNSERATFGVRLVKTQF